jgi:hypothetical protein
MRNWNGADRRDGVGLAPEDRQGKDRAGPTIANGNDDVAEMDSRAITNGELELCIQPAVRPLDRKTKMKSANSENFMQGSLSAALPVRARRDAICRSDIQHHSLECPWAGMSNPHA